jgi:LmbE family N-acetylglucosaminyl deacetylase
MDDQHKDHDQNTRVLVMLAHPDDPEFFCGGTIARWTSLGWDVSYLLFTRGDKGNDEVGTDSKALAELRMQEQRAAAKILGVTEVEFLDYPDGYLVPDIQLRKDLVRAIRIKRPKIVVTCDPTNYFPGARYINHPDHRAAGQATIDAVFPAAGSGLYFTEMLDLEGVKPHKVEQVYVSMAQHPNTVIDVTRFVDLKIKALQEHKSQIKDMEQLAHRIRERMLDRDSPPEVPRYIETFKRIDLRR